MKTGIIFDLDGTLLDTLDDLHLSTNAALRHFGYPERTKQEVRRFLGNGAKRLIARSCPENADNVDEALAWYKAYYDAHCREHTGPYAGITEALTAIKKEYPTAIVSNKPDAAVKILCAEHFPGVFAMGEQAPFPHKPAPDMIFAAMESIGVEKCIYVGDSEVDVLTAQNGNFPCISVLWGFRDEDELVSAGAKYLCHDPKDLKNLIESIENGK